MINITYKLVDLYLKFINLTINKQLFCKKMKKNSYLLIHNVKKGHLLQN